MMNTSFYASDTERVGTCKQLGGHPREPRASLSLATLTLLSMGFPRLDASTRARDGGCECLDQRPGPHRVHGIRRSRPRTQPTVAFTFA